MHTCNILTQLQQKMTDWCLGMSPAMRERERERERKE
jgi:hypothetical protein